MSFGIIVTLLAWIAQIRIFQQSYQISLHRLLQSQYHTALEMHIWIVDLSYLPYQSLKWHSSYEKFRRLLVSSYFSQHYSSWPVSSGFSLLLAHVHLCSWRFSRSCHCRVTCQPVQIFWLWYIWFIIPHHVSCKLIHQMIMFFSIGFPIYSCPPDVHTSSR